MDAAWLALALTPGVGPKRFLRGFKAHPQDPERAASALGVEKAYARLLASGKAEAAIAKTAELGARVLGPMDPEYPEGLLHLPDPPPALYVRGELPSYKAAAAVVGTRRASPWAAAFARDLAAALGRAGLWTVSGLARGIDAAAHRGALEVGGKTLAVLGSGLDRVYPPEHRDLAQKATLVSEHPPGTDPRPEHFPRRNRLIAALSRAVAVVEAPERSGALITAGVALELGREVLAVPGRPTDLKSRGTNRLIQDGAFPLIEAQEVLRVLGIGENTAKDPELPEHLKGLYRSLAELGEALPDDLAAQNGLSLPGVLAALSELELLGLAEPMAGGRYRAR